MPCPTPSSAPTPPTLAQLLAELAEVDPIGAERLRPEAEGLEARQADVRARLATAEAELQRVTLDQAAYEDWALRHRDATSLRHEERLLSVDAGGMRSQLERELFLAHRAAAMGVGRCQSCGGTGDGEPLDGGTCLVPTSCDTCAGTGSAAPRG
ncbi:hypothetical protein [Vitiosangium sp. GDMCC 1.1324]|uniref:hypothetical protein n=1 Tax=Vitiosangium sp. (strain GDMCC 1.1324) TaxID=2138576 RepID=UPI00130EB6B1|nr:hypothetical protein [Vitiosangium sp. GDMCC 1.1324]